MGRRHLSFAQLQIWAEFPLRNDPMSPPGARAHCAAWSAFSSGQGLWLVQSQVLLRPHPHLCLTQPCPHCCVPTSAGLSHGSPRSAGCAALSGQWSPPASPDAGMMRSSLHPDHLLLVHLQVNPGCVLLSASCYSPAITACLFPFHCTRQGSGELQRDCEVLSTMLPHAAVCLPCSFMSSLYPCNNKGKKLLGTDVRTCGGGTEKACGLAVQVGAKVPQRELGGRRKGEGSGDVKGKEKGKAGKETHTPSCLRGNALGFGVCWKVLRKGGCLSLTWTALPGSGMALKNSWGMEPGVF